MQLKQFLEQPFLDNFLSNNAQVLAFVYSSEKSLPILFASYLATQLKRDTSIESIQVTELTLPQILSRMQTSFLGMQLIYWLKGIEELDKKTQQSLFRYLEQYQGPHRIFLFCTAQNISDSAKLKIVELPDHINGNIVSSLLNFTNKKNLPLEKQLISLAKTYETLTLDQACMILQYAQIMNKSDDITPLIDRIIESEKSLFTLSQHFFAKNSQAFYQLWSIYEDHYPITFWCVYWSEQLWRAYYTRLYMEKSHYSQAKTISARLPFSYLQRDWKKTSLFELKHAHQWIYDLDRAGKNNVETVLGIDIFYNKFFLNEFDTIRE